MRQRELKNMIFALLYRLATWLTLGILLILLTHIVREGLEWLSWDFVKNFPSRRPSRAGIKAGIWGSLWVIAITAAFAIPVGIATALFVEEYMLRNRWALLLQVNINNLAGMPSIIYGLLGLAIFVRFLGFERSVLAGGLTLGLLVLPVVIIASQGAIRAVPATLREAAYAVGAYRWQVLWGQVVPAALPGIMTGIILAISRSLGETAPLIIVGALSYMAFVPVSITDPFTVMPLQIFNWASRPQPDFHGLAAAGIIILLGILLSLNIVAVFIRHKFQR